MLHMMEILKVKRKLQEKNLNNNEFFFFKKNLLISKIKFFVQNN